jgi:hypothetical protein
VGFSHPVATDLASRQKAEVLVTAEHEIRADYDRTTIVVYQAFNDAIADAALAAGRFVAPFSMQRMTWIKPSFLWLMERSGWGTKSNQERILAVRIKRAGWDKALSLAVLTSFVPGVFASPDEWAVRFAAAQVHLQWDPERSFAGPDCLLQHPGGSELHIIREYVEEWVVGIEDCTARVRKIANLLQSGQADGPNDSCRPSACTRRGDLGRRLLIGGRPGCVQESG